MNPLDELIVPKPFYRRLVRAVLAADMEGPKPPQEKKPLSPAEAAMEIRKVASDAIARLMALSESLAPEARDAAERAINEGVEKMNAYQAPHLEALAKVPPAQAPAPAPAPVIKPQSKPAPGAPMRAHGIQEPNKQDIEDAKRDAARVVKEVEKKAPEPKAPVSPEHKVFSSTQEEIDFYTQKLNEAKTDADKANYRRILDTYKPFIKKSESVPAEPKPKPAEQAKPVAEAKAPEAEIESPLAKENTELKKELEDLRRQFEELRDKAGKKTEPKPRQPEEQERKNEQPRPAGPASQAIQEAVNRAAARIARPGFLEQTSTRFQEGLQGINKWWWSILEKRAKENMVAFEARSKALKVSEEQFADKSFWHTAVAPVWFGLFGGKWYGAYFQGRWRADRKRERYAGLYDRYHHYKEVREHQRNDLFNIDAARIDALLKQYEGQAKESQQRADAINEKIDNYYREHNEQVLAQQGEYDPKKRIEMTRQIDDRLILIDALQQAKAEELNKFAAANGKATKYRSQKDETLRQIKDLSPEPTLTHEEVRKKPGRKPAQSKAA